MTYSAHQAKVIAVDFDGTLAITPSHHEDFPKANPLMVSRVLEHYARYEFIVIFTARPEQDRSLVVKCLTEWGVPYDAIVMNKIRFDVLYDDKAIGKSSDDWPR